MNKSIIFINQSPNDMLCDIGEAYKLSGYQCTLISGNRIKGDEVFHKVVTFHSYQRTTSLSRLKSWWKFYTEVKKWLSNNHVDFEELFLVTNPPFLLYLPYYLKNIRNKTLHALVYDLYPDILRNMLPGFLIELPARYLAHLNKKSYPLFKHIYSPSYSLSRAISQYCNTPVQTIYNWTDLSKIKPVNKKENPFIQKNNLQHKFIVLYSGNLGRTHDVETILSCATLTREHQDIIYVFIGEGEGMDPVKKEISSGASNIVFLEMQSDDMYQYSISCGDRAWVGYKKGFEAYSIPSKLPNYLASGTPVISIGATDSELSLLLTGNQIGFAVDNNDSSALAAIIIKAYSHPDKDIRDKCLTFAHEHFSKKNAKMFLK